MTKPIKTSSDTEILPDRDDFFRQLDVEFLIHELKDPLSVIETAVRMLLEKQEKFGVLTERQDKTLKRALKSSRKVRSLIGDLLEVGRSDTGCFECRRFDAVAAVNDVLVESLETVNEEQWDALQSAGSDAQRQTILSRSGIVLRSAASGDDLQLCQDETKFRQIVGNLIKNALQYRERCLEIVIDRRDEWLVVEVLDDGPGIEEKHRELIFQRYTRLGPEARGALSRPGHGLGLAGARILARHLGGDITAGTRCGPGTVFRLTLPMNFKEWKGNQAWQAIDPS